ncbi:MAG: PRC-barrel domain-containing protein [archaeon]|nr:PRC-barrel domain-containing protein [archaeon]
MVEISKFYDLDIYTLAGQYVGQVQDVVLNIRYGTISRLQVRALEPEKKNMGFRDMFRSGFQFTPEEEPVRNFQEGLLSVDFDKVKAIGDIILIDPQDMKRPAKQQIPGEVPITPNQGANKQIPSPEVNKQ